MGLQLPLDLLEAACCGSPDLGVIYSLKTKLDICI